MRTNYVYNRHKSGYMTESRRQIARDSFTADLL